MKIVKSQRQSTIFSITRLIIISIFCIAVSAHAAGEKKKNVPVVTAVTVTNESAIIVDIIGVNFTAGKDAPIVTLGGQVMTIDVGTLIDTFVSASLLAAILPGDYFLTVTHSKGVGQYDLTVGAVGPQGPKGETGAPGATGAMGPLGFPGQYGADGDDGADGADGANGADGADGAVGQSCTVAACPPEGVTTLSCGATQVEIPCVPHFALRDEGPAGGIVFHITPDGLHGLEAAPEEQGFAPWGCFGAYTGATGVEIDDGATNTTTIIDNGCQRAGDAATIAAAYMGPTGDTPGWFLPSKNELNKMYEELHLFGFGGFANVKYWSSSEINKFGLVWFQGFSNGGQFVSLKDFVTKRVRAVRAF